MKHRAKIILVTVVYEKFGNYEGRFSTIDDKDFEHVLLGIQKSANQRL